MNRLLSALCLAGIAAAAWTAPARALIRYDFEERFFVDRPQTVADRCIVRRDSTYHLFYTAGPVGVFTPSLQTSFGHATSRDLVHWTIQPAVLPTVPGTWESMAHWAPMILEKPAGTYNMLYTGVDSNNVQQIGLATSTDLYSWTRSPANPVFHTDGAWSDWTPQGYCNCRDPFVWQDGDTLRMLVTAVTQYGQGAVGLAASTNFTDWVDQGPVAQMPSGPTSWHQMEAPLVTQFGGRWQLYYGETEKLGVRWVSAPSFRGPWDLTTPALLDYGAAGELLTVNDSLFFHRHTSYEDGDTSRTVVRVDPIALLGDSPMVVSDRLLPRAWSVSGSAFDSQPCFGDNTALRGAGHCNLQGSGWIGTGDDYPGPLVGGAPGAAQSNTLTGEMVSPEFVIAGDSLAALVGGGNKPDSVYLAVCDACTDSVLFRATGSNSEAMAAVQWPVRALRGQRAYLRIADHATGTWGHINCDEIREVASTAPPVPTPSLLLLAPLGGTSITVNTATTIRWRPTDVDPSARVSIYLSQDKGATYPVLVGTANPGDSSYVWTVNVAGGSLVRLKLVARSPAGITCCDRNTSDVSVLMIAIQNVSVCNVTDTTALIFWTTIAPADGAVEIGTTPLLGSRFVQPPGDLTTLHFVALQGLQARQTYYFRVSSLGEVSDNGGALYSFTTAQRVTGQIYRLRGTVTQDGVGFANVAVLATLKRAGVTAYPLIVSSTATGFWSVDLGNARDPLTGIALRAQAGDSVRVVLLQDASEKMVLDPVIITGVSPQSQGLVELVTGVETPPAPDATWLLSAIRVSPLPAPGGVVTLSFRLAYPATVAVRILDVGGREVRRMDLGAQAAGAARARWDGHDAQGRAAPSGIYFADITAGTPRAAQRARIVVVR